MGCRSRKSVWLSVLIIVMLVEGWFSECEGCLKQERDALLHLKAVAAFVYGVDDWVDGTDCCQWFRVECNTRRRVSELHLSYTRDYDLGSWYLNLSDFQAFDDIKILDLTCNNIAGFVENKGNETLLWKIKLESLYLSSNNLRNDIISILSGFQHLKSLDMSFNKLEGSLDITGICALNKLKMLDLSYNYNISDFLIPQGINNCQDNLKVLNLIGLKMEVSMLQKSLRALFPSMTGNTFNGTLNAQGNERFSRQTSWLEDLDLSDNCLSNDIIPFLSEFQHLKSLDLSYNLLEGSLDINDFGGLMKLEQLILDGSSNIGNQFFKSIGELTSLKVLSLSSCGIKGRLLTEGWSKLKKLKELDISNNEFDGPIGLSFINMTSLHRLILRNNSFTGIFASNLATLTSLEDLDFSSNQLEVISSFNFLANYSNLKSIDGSGNRVITDPHPSSQTWVPKFQLQSFGLSSISGANSIPFPNFLIHQYNLTSIDLSGIKFQGNFPNWLLENNTKLESLHLENCSFIGHFQLPSHVNPHLDSIYASDNMITGQFPSNITTIFPNLQDLNMASNAMYGSLPLGFGQTLYWLDLSDNHLSGEMPRNLSVHGSSFEILLLSNNVLSGSVCPTLTALKGLEELWLDGNSFFGSISSCFFNASLHQLDISNNHFVGKLPAGIKNSSNLEMLSIANNHLEGSIPTEITEQQYLRYLDLSGNYLSGSIPSFVLSPIQNVLLNNNRFSGLAKTMFNKSLPLEMLDLSHNSISCKIQRLTGSISQLNILLLRDNHFKGQILNICHLKNLILIDLSYNSLSGPIPNCLSEFHFETEEQLLPFSTIWCRNYTRDCDPSVYLPSVDLEVTFTTKGISYTYEGSILANMFGIDLSHNNLNGSIPVKLGNLTHIRAINLSHNHLSGQIPITFSNLKQVESLDLSFNNLSGEIPYQLTELTYLEVFSLAHNNLSGSTPEWKGQFITFDESSYEGNPFLCGPPLNKSCTPLGIFPNTSGVEASNNGGIMDMEFFYISFVVSYTSILLIIVLILYINPQWRRAWFYFIESIIIYGYYYFCKLFT